MVRGLSVILFNINFYLFIFLRGFIYWCYLELEVHLSTEYGGPLYVILIDVAQRRVHPRVPAEIRTGDLLCGRQAC
jgi:hypothetical protein